MLEDIRTSKDKPDYVYVFKLSRFGRNAADTMNSIQYLEDHGVKLLAVEDNIDSSDSSGKLIINVISSVAEIERENIHTQTMAGRWQKAREGRWNGGFAPYGYKLVNGELEIADDEADLIREIYKLFTENNIGTVEKCMLLGKVAIDALRDYEEQKKTGKKPVFKAEDIGLNAEELDFWK